MRARIKRVAAIVLAGFLVGTLLLLFRDFEPSYSGYSLAKWVKIYRADANNALARETICRIASNSIPRLVQELQYDPRPRQKWVFNNIERRLPRRLLEQSIIVHLILRDRKDQRAAKAMFVLSMVGQGARQAVPQLTQLVMTTNLSDVVYGRVMGVLANIDKDAAKTLIPIMLNSSHPGRRQAMAAMIRSPTFAEPVIPQVLLALEDPNPRVASSAVEVLENYVVLGVSTNVVLPALQKASLDSRPQVRDAATEVLEGYKALTGR